MATLWGSCITLEGLFQASALGQSAEQGNAWLQTHVAGRLLQDAATMARIAAELYRLVDGQSQQVSILKALQIRCSFEVWRREKEGQHTKQSLACTTCMQCH